MGRIISSDYEARLIFTAFKELLKAPLGYAVANLSEFDYTDRVKAAQFFTNLISAGYHK